MIPNAIGNIAIEEWQKAPVIRPDMNTRLDAFQLMPDHFHGIVQIGQNPFNKKESPATMEEQFRHVKAEAIKGYYNDSIRRGHFGPQSKNLSIIINHFKGAVTRRARKIDPGFAWQSRFYDRIIRDMNAMNAVRRYIWNNPKKWRWQ